MNMMRHPGRKSPDDLFIVIEADIKASIDIVFSVVEDLSLFVELEENVKKVTVTSAVKKGLGLKTSWELYHPDTMESWFVDEEIVLYDPPCCYAYEGKSPDGKDYAGTHFLTALNEDTTRLRFEEYFYFSIGEKEIREVVSGMVANVKKASEERYKELLIGDV